MVSVEQNWELTHLRGERTLYFKFCSSQSNIMKNKLENKPFLFKSFWQRNIHHLSVKNDTYRFKVIQLSSLNANVYNRQCTNVVIRYLLFKVPRANILFSVVIFKSPLWWNCVLINMFGEDNIIDTSPDPWRILSSSSAYLKWNSWSLCPGFIRPLMFPSLPVAFTELSLIFIHHNRPCLSFSTLIQINSKHKSLSSAGYGDDSSSCLKGILQKQYTKERFSPAPAGRSKLPSRADLILQEYLRVMCFSVLPDVVIRPHTNAANL